MKKVEMTVGMVGTDCERRVGDKISVSDAEAGRLIAAGFAKEVAEESLGERPKPNKEKEPKDNAAK